MFAEQVIVVVEDDPDDRALLKRAFAKAGIVPPIRFAEDGEQAVITLAAMAGESTIRPALVLLDLKLPRRSGFEVLQWIKGHPCLRRIPVVILTSSDESRDLELAYDLGANSYLLKPVVPDALLNMVEMIEEYWLSLNELSPPFRIT